MDLQQSIQCRLDTLFRGFLQLIADHYQLNYDELHRFVETIDWQGGKVTKSLTGSATCMHKMTRGKNKGKFCTSKALENNYCGKHQSGVATTIGTIVKKTKQTPAKGMSKTQLQIIEWLNTAVPQDEVVLKKRSKGLLHEETDIVFNDDYVVIGRINNDKIIKLGSFEVELCEKRGWQYDENAVDLEESDSDS